MRRTDDMTALLFWLAILNLPLSVQAQQRETIPELVAKGAVSGIGMVPSGPTPSVPELLRAADLVVKGTIGQPRSYLAEDQRDVYTDYPISEPTFIYQSQMTATSIPGMLPSATITLRGGTVMVNGVKFAQTEPALRPLQPGTQGLFILQRVGDKYRVAGTYFGAFGIKDGKVMPLTARDDFAPEYRNVALSNVVDSMMTTLRARMQSPK